MPNQDADMAEYLLSQSRRELERYPRNPIVVEPQTAKDIDLSGIHRMSTEAIEAELQALRAA